MSVRLLVLGAPGSGKGTQATRLLRQMPAIEALSLGDILRSQIDAGTAVGRQAAGFIKSGQLVPDRTMVALIEGELRCKRWLNAQSSWLLDGFPRTAAQAAALDELLRPHGVPISLVVELDVDQRVILDRIEARWVHLASGRVYNLDYNPPKVAGRDDVTGEPLTKREDDTAAVFQKRLDRYNAEIGPLREFYRGKGVLTTVAGNTSDVIFPKFLAAVRATASARA